VLLRGFRARDGLACRDDLDAEKRPLKAVVYDRYGPPEVLRIGEVERPVPKPGDVLVSIHATTVTRSDCGVRGSHPFFSRIFTGIRAPKQRIVGTELAGIVEEVGEGVTEFQVGDRVFGFSSGANAELVCVREQGALARIPAGMDFAQAAALSDGPSIANACLSAADLRQGQSVVIYGATGSIGSAAVQLAKARGAEVTAVADTDRLDLVRSLGADAVVDYTRNDFTRNGKRYDVVVDSVGKHSFRRCRGSLKPGGTYIETDLGVMWHVPLLALGTRWIGDKRVRLPIPKYTKEDVLLVKRLVEEGKYRPVIDRTYALEDVVEATRYVEKGQKTGNVVLELGSAG
jgi:NADPH:quinone reductase-like Zn-dependent oxidoreductase